MLWSFADGRPDFKYGQDQAEPAFAQESPWRARLKPLQAAALRWWARWGRVATRAFCIVVVPPMALVLYLAYHVYLDRSHVPNLDAFIRLDLPVTGEVRDSQGRVLIEMAREYRKVVSYGEVPVVVRQAILSTEDRNFFSHGGVEYRSLPRIVQKAVEYTLASWRKGGRGAQVRFPQGGSTLTQQLVRGYFLSDLTGREAGRELLHRGLGARLLSVVLGVPAANQLCRKIEEVRLAFWLEEQMRKRYGSRERAKQEIFARYASFVYLGNGRYGFAAASEFYFDKPLGTYTAEDAGKAALLVGILKAPRDYAPAPGNRKALRRRNEILALMARNGDIPATIAKKCHDEPVVIVARSTTETEAPAAVQNVIQELNLLDKERFSMDDLVQGRIAVNTTVDARFQTIVNEALENGLAQYEKRHPKAKGLIQGSVVVLQNGDAAILAQAGGRRTYNDRATRYFDLNRATGSLRQPGSAWKPLVYLAGFTTGLTLDSEVLDDPISVPMGNNGEVKWISNYDGEFKGAISLRQALAESRNAVAVRIASDIGLEKVIWLAKALGVRTPIQPYLTTALGASEVRLVELASIYRAMASGILAEPHCVSKVMDPSGNVLYEAPPASRGISAAGLTMGELSEIQEGLRSVVRLPGGTANSLDGGGFPIPVMGKTGTTTDYKDALFVGSTYGPSGITVAVRIGFDDNHSMGARETGGRAALPIFREIMLRAYKDGIAGPVPRFPSRMERRIDAYLAEQALISSQTAPALDPIQAMPVGYIR